jgi:hypothetical protein
MTDGPERCGAAFAGILWGMLLGILLWAMAVWYLWVILGS